VRLRSVHVVAGNVEQDAQQVNIKNRYIIGPENFSDKFSS
jgi:hypothetical protein